VRKARFLAWVGLACSLACAARGQRYAAPDAAAESAAFPAATAAAQPEDDLAAYEARLRGYEDSLRAEGVVLATRPADAEEPAPVEGRVAGEAPADDARDEAEAGGERTRYRAPAAKRARPDAGTGGLRGKDRCQRICDLAHATCGLADRICELAGRHRGEARYEETCTRAEEDCRVATEACRSCAP
jgi:hypothetical protein